MTKVLLYSGGMDSWLINKDWKPDVLLYVDIHGGYSEAEKKRLPDNAKILDFPLLGGFELSNRFIPMRNLYFLMLASQYGDKICLGAMAGDYGNKDKTPEFLQMSETMINELLSDKKVRRRIEIERQYITAYKNELLRKYIKNGGTANEVKDSTFSCYTPIEGKECFHCYPCFRKFALLYSNGADYSYEQRKAMWDYVREQIIPTKEQGGYQGTYYTDRGIESEDLIKAVEMLRTEFEVG